MEIFQLKQSNFIYPSSIQKYFGRHTPAVITGLGNLDVLNHKKQAFFCSVRCPGHLILKAYDLAQQLKERGVTVVSGFHSPIERECLRILLRGTQPIILCPARSLKGMRLKKEYKKPIEEGRLLLLSPFKESQKRNSAETATERNRFVAALADSIFIAHASGNSKMERFCREILGWGKSLYTFESGANKSIINIGAKVFSINDLHSLK
ncbi:MAG: DNA-processing protein DprA [Deltaproteobacteria bacterium]|nr:DNA-processing protein DprA [Deltaproteobacteria bacterium]